MQADPKFVAASEIAPNTDLIVTAHSHARVTKEALAAAKLGGIGYHPSLLPRHRGIAAIEWTIKEGDPIAGGSVYHLADRMDAGAIAAQEWVFVKKGETARELWERALAPLGQKLLGDVIDYAKTHKSLPAKPQDEQFATKAPSLPTVNTRVFGARGRRIGANPPPGTIFLFPSRNRIHLDVFESTGTFRLAAAHQSLDTLCPDKARHHTHFSRI